MSANTERAARPMRVQLSRKKGWRMPPNTVKVARPTKWGNPFIVGKDGDADNCVSLYRSLISGVLFGRRNKNLFESLRGKNLACWCKPGTPCHADVLLEFANVDDVLRGGV